jgi:hypothetical protein
VSAGQITAEIAAFENGFALSSLERNSVDFSVIKGPGAISGE